MKLGVTAWSVSSNIPVTRQCAKKYDKAAADKSPTVKKSNRSNQEALETHERYYEQALEDMRAIRAKRDELPFPMPVDEYEKAQAAIAEARPVLCGALAFQIRDRHAQLIQQYQRLDAQTDLTKPQEWYSYARLDRRKVRIEKPAR